MGTSFPSISLANPNTYQNFGLVVSDIANNQAGKVCCLGFMFGLDTSAWAPDTLLYSDVSGNLTSTALGSPVASVIKQNATTGVIYVTAISDQITPPSSASWGLSGNTTSAGSFLGTVNSESLKFRTNNTQKAVLDINGRFGLGTSTPTRHLELKAHVGSTSTGIQQESFELQTNSGIYQNIYTMTLSDPSSIMLEVYIQGKDSVTGDICSFKRNGFFYRNAGNVTLGPTGWQSSFTSKTNTQMNISYTLGMTDLDIKVKGLLSGNLTNWTGYIILQELKI
jgi:hypothetical protein